jgi:hypothetical protein
MQAIRFTGPAYQRLGGEALTHQFGGLQNAVSSVIARQHNDNVGFCGSFGTDQILARGSQPEAIRNNYE